MSDQIWEVVGGGKQGGILVRAGKDTKSTEESERLSTGALVQQISLEDGRMQYDLLSGSGPKSGWVSLKLKNQDLLVRYQVWEVVGGKDSGGLVVKEGKDTASSPLADRLSFGALVRELELDGSRLHYEKQSGTGPQSGWVSLKAGGKELLAKKDKPPLPVKEFLPEELKSVGKAILKEVPPPALPTELAKTLGQYIEFDEKNVNASHPGAHFGEIFPHTPEQLKDMGAEWLTKAFHKAGSLPEDNKVARVVSQRSFVGGGAAVKVILTLEYEKPADDLHTELFVKMPLEAEHKNRKLNIQMTGEGREIFFNRFFAQCMPFRTAKYYFGDISMSTTNWILITEKIAFADSSRQGEQFAPNEIEPVVRKGLDFCLPRALDKYVALYRRAAMLTAWAHTGKLGGQLPEFYPMGKGMVMIGFPVMAKQFDDFWPALEDFVLKTARQLFPSDVATQDYVAKLKTECVEIAPLLAKVNKYCTTGENLWGFMHPNLHVDNAFFFRDEESRQDCGLLDWGMAGVGFLLLQFISGGGALSLAGAEMRVPYTDGLVTCYFDTLAEFGGPRLDAADMCLRVALMDMAYIIGSMRLIGTDRPGDVYEYLPKEQYATVTGLEDPVFAADTIEALMLRSVVMMLVEGIKVWKGRDYGKMFKAWRVANPK